MAAEPQQRAALGVLGACCVFNYTWRGLIESFVVFVLPLSHGFGWDRASVVSIYSLAMLASGFAAPLAGRVFDRFGPRVVYTTGLGLIGGALSLAPSASALWHFQLCLGVAVGTGAACLSNAPNSAMVSRWFRERLALAMSVVYSAAGIGILTLVPLAQYLNQRVGWQGTWRWFGVGVLVLLVLTQFLPWARWRAGGRGLVRPGAAIAGAAGSAATLRSAIGHAGFWGLFTVFLCTSIGMYQVVVQVVAYLIDVGFPPLQAATAWGMSGILLPIGMLLFGWLDGRIGRRTSVLVSYACSLAGIVCLFLLGLSPNVWLLGAFVVLFGGTVGSRGPLISTIAMNLFRGGNVATIFGTISIGAGLGGAIGSWIGGVLHDWTGGYQTGLAVAFCFLILGMSPFLLVPSLRR